MVGDLAVVHDALAGVGQGADQALGQVEQRRLEVGTAHGSESGWERRGSFGADVTGVGPGVRESVGLVEGLGGLQRGRSGQTEAGVGESLQIGEVEQSRRCLLGALALDFGDAASLSAHLGGQGLGLGGGGQSVGFSAEPAAGIPGALGLEVRQDYEVVRRAEGPDLGLTLHQEGQGGRLNPAGRPEPAMTRRQGHGRVHADQPVGLRPRPRRRLQGGHRRPQGTEGGPNGGGGGLGEPEALDRPGVAADRADVGPDKFALPPRIGGHHP